MIIGNSIIPIGMSLNLIVSFKYLDVAFLTAVLDPLSIIVFLLALIKINNVRKSKLDDHSSLDKVNYIIENESSKGGK